MYCDFAVVNLTFTDFWLWPQISLLFYRPDYPIVLKVKVAVLAGLKFEVDHSLLLYLFCGCVGDAVGLYLVLYISNLKFRSDMGSTLDRARQPHPLDLHFRRTFSTLRQHPFSPSGCVLYKLHLLYSFC